VLVYVLLADHRVEIVAAADPPAKVAQAEWQACLRDDEEAVRAGRFEEGSVAAVEAVLRAPRGTFPAGTRTRNEAAGTRPVML